MFEFQEQIRISSMELNRRLGVETVAGVVRLGQLSWFRHLERRGRDDWVSICRGFEVAGPKSRGRSRKTWGGCVKQDLQSLNFKAE